MRHHVVFVVILVCFATLFLLCYAPALFLDRQFGYRDAGHYYYPLYQRVQREWEAWRVPLWEPEENSGMPLLGNPTAAVLYPGKVIYALLPYPWAARLYVVGHTVLAFAAMLVLMRSWQTSWVGSGLSALAYAFGAPILFQYCNVIYLIGAAWLPLGVHAVDRWVRLGRRWAVLELAVVLAMLTLGGDPQSAYFVGLAAGGYSLGLVWNRARRNSEHARLTSDPPLRRPGLWRWVLLVGIGLVVWAVATVALACWLPRVREAGTPTPPFRWMVRLPLAVSLAWGMAGLVFLNHWRRRGWRLPLGVMWLGLAVSAVLALALSAAQFVPVVEFTQRTVRAAGGGPHDIYPFSLEPFRLVELIWPNVLGIQFEGNTYWLDTVKLAGVRPKIWVPSLYLGGLTLALALSTMALRNGPPWRVWLSVIVGVSFLGSLGAYTSPIWIARSLDSALDRPGLRELTKGLGPFDQIDATPIRQDGYLRDGDGGIYWWMTTVLPGFRQFRFPSKMLTFASLALAALAGIGWDELCAGRRRMLSALLWLLLALSLATLAAVSFERQAVLTAFRNADVATMFGPFQPEGGYRAIVSSLTQASIIFGLSLCLMRLVRSRPQLAGAMALMVMTADLAVANARYVLTVPQYLLEKKPEVARILEEAERTDPAPGPFRVHRMPLWSPPGWQRANSSDRVLDFVTWERDTLQPKHAINLGIEYTHTVGVAELYDYEWYFNGFPRIVRKPEAAKALGIELGTEIVYYPRRAFDMWNTRYFIVPSYPNGWRDELRATASFMMQSEAVYPPSDTFRGPNGNEALKRWIDTNDFQIVRNLNMFPRAWVVHDARAIKPVSELSRENRADAMQEIVYARDDLWFDDTMIAYDPHSLAWLDSDTIRELGHYVYPPRQPVASETVKVSYPNPQQVALEATLKHPGLLILADIYYPGWELSIDGQPAPIYPVNRMMRGAALEAGTHRLLYTYNPQSFRVGLAASILGLAAALVGAVLCAARPIEPMLAQAGHDAASD
jgi:hypothetical protein